MEKLFVQGVEDEPVEPPEPPPDEDDGKRKPPGEPVPTDPPQS